MSTRFLSAGTQAVETRQLLPLPEPTGRGRAARRSSTTREGYTEFEPESPDLLVELVPRYVEAAVFGALLEAAASEHTARQRAMAAATDNADDLAKTLTRDMNRARQDAITTEIMEIVGGAEALRQAADAKDTNRKQEDNDIHRRPSPPPAHNGQRPDGRVVAIAGPVVDVEFPPHALPEINMAVEMDLDARGQTKSPSPPRWRSRSAKGRVRCVCLKPTDGLHRGTAVRNLGRGLAVPVGDATLGHVFNVLGRAPRHRRHRRGRGPVGDPPRLARLRPARAACPHVRDRDQGHRPPRAVRAGREDRPVRRGRASARPCSSRR